MHPPSTEDLINIVRKYYDSSNVFLFTTEPTLEENRRQSLWVNWTENMEPWRALRAKLRAEFPSYKVGETFSSADGGARCVVYPSREFWLPKANWEVVGCVSLLAPVCFVYGVEYGYSDGRTQNYKASFGPPPSNMVFPAQVVAKTVESIFGFSALPREVAEIPVPLYAGLLEPPETTLFHTLFTSAPSSVP